MGSITESQINQVATIVRQLDANTFVEIHNLLMSDIFDTPEGYIYTRDEFNDLHSFKVVLDLNNNIDLTDILNRYKHVDSSDDFYFLDLDDDDDDDDECWRSISATDLMKELSYGALWAFTVSLLENFNQLAPTLDPAFRNKIMAVLNEL